MADILVVDDEVGIRELLSEILGDEGHEVLLAENATQARRIFKDSRQNGCPVNLVLLDIWMPDTDGVTLLKEWVVEGTLTMPVIMMSGHATIDTAVEATRIGALDFLEKPIALHKLLKAVEQGLQHGRSVAAMRAPAPLYEPLVAHPGMVPMISMMTPGASATVLPLGAKAPQFVTSPVIAARGANGAALRELPLDLPLREARDVFERAYFEHHLSREHGSMTRVAEKTGLERTHLYRKLKQLGIDLSKGAYRKSGQMAQ